MQRRAVRLGARSNMLALVAVLLSVVNRGYAEFDFSDVAIPGVPVDMSGAEITKIYTGSDLRTFDCASNLIDGNTSSKCDGSGSNVRDVQVHMVMPGGVPRDIVGVGVYGALAAGARCDRYRFIMTCLPSNGIPSDCTPQLAGFRYWTSCKAGTWFIQANMYTLPKVTNIVLYLTSSSSSLQVSASELVLFAAPPPTPSPTSAPTVPPTPLPPGFTASPTAQPTPAPTVENLTGSATEGDPGAVTNNNEGNDNTIIYVIVALVAVLVVALMVGFIVKEKYKSQAAERVAQVNATAAIQAAQYGTVNMSDPYGSTNMMMPGSGAGTMQIPYDSVPPETMMGGSFNAGGTGTMMMMPNGTMMAMPPMQQQPMAGQFNSMPAAAMGFHMQQMDMGMGAGAYGDDYQQRQHRRHRHHRYSSSDSDYSDSSEEERRRRRRAKRRAKRDGPAPAAPMDPGDDKRLARMSMPLPSLSQLEQMPGWGSDVRFADDSDLQRPANRAPIVTPDGADGAPAIAPPPMGFGNDDDDDEAERKAKKKAKKEAKKAKKKAKKEAEAAAAANGERQSDEAGSDDDEESPGAVVDVVPMAAPAETVSE